MDKAPHQSIITVTYDIYERNNLGQCMPGIKDGNAIVLTFFGNSLDEVKNKTLSFFKKVKKDAEQANEESASE
jgi:hypothetical protein